MHPLLKQFLEETVGIIQAAHLEAQGHSHAPHPTQKRKKQEEKKKLRVWGWVAACPANLSEAHARLDAGAQMWAISDRGSTKRSKLESKLDLLIYVVLEK